MSDTSDPIYIGLLFVKKFRFQTTKIKLTETSKTAKISAFPSHKMPYVETACSARYYFVAFLQVLLASLKRSRNSNIASRLYSSAVHVLEKIPPECNKNKSLNVLLVFFLNKMLWTHFLA